MWFSAEIAGRNANSDCLPPNMTPGSGCLVQDLGVKVSLVDYRDEFAACMKRLGKLPCEEYSIFQWRAVYITRGCSSYFFRGALDGIYRNFTARTVDRKSGNIRQLSPSMLNLLTSGFAQNAVIGAYDGPEKPVAKVAEDICSKTAPSFQPEFFYVFADLLHASSQGRFNLPEEGRIHDLTKMIFVGLKRSEEASAMETDALGTLLARESELRSPTWFLERHAYR
ncbi:MULTISPECIES: hypothetical protein [unclassified Sinorhizobium]|uniref:hypothetical protein n=1 Tax=unclassified Sinorhizobium TaxID=2613772 RepID=UPI00352523E6